jgi:hypothetical protein
MHQLLRNTVHSVHRWWKKSFAFIPRGFEFIKQRKMRNTLLRKWFPLNVMILAVVRAVAVRAFASAVFFCVWLDAVQVPGGQERFSYGK